MVEELTRNWWAVALRGAFALLFGLLTLVWPTLTVVVLVALFGAWALLDGVFAFAAAWRRAERRQTWWPFLVEGILGVAAAVVTWVWPQITALGLEDEGVPDREDELIAEGSVEMDEFASPEEAALSVRDEAPGATDHEDPHPDQDREEDE